MQALVWMVILEVAIVSLVGRARVLDVVHVVCTVKPPGPETFRG